jgi:hypothetical protein
MGRLGVSARLAAVALVALIVLAPISATAASNPPGSPELLPGQARLLGIGGTLVWTGSIPGDYDQNGEVNSADVTPLGLRFNQQSPIGRFFFGEMRAQVDGDNNGEINFGDLTIIGQNFGRKLEGFSIYSSADPADYPAGGMGPNGSGATLIGTATAWTKPSPDSARRWEFQPPGANASDYFWVRPVDDQGSEGIASTLATEIGLNVPSHPENIVELSLTPEGNLHWLHQLLGDYDQNGEVNIADLTPVMLNQTSADSFADTPFAEMLDGNNDHSISIMDTTVCGVYFLLHIDGYALYRSSSLDDYPQTPAEENGAGAELMQRFRHAGHLGPLESYLSGEPNAEREYAEFPAPVESADYYYWVRPFYDQVGYQEGIASNWVLVPAAQ